MKKYFAFLLIASILTLPQQAFAVGSGGFENASFSAESLGEGNAVVAQADEAAAISYNPAGLINLKGLQVQTNNHFISIFTFHDGPTDSHTRSSGTIVPVPTAYMAINPGPILKNRFAFGIGSDSPFGLSNKYDSANTIAHYTGWRNWLKMYTVKPVMAIKLTDWLSMGGGPVYYRIFDFGGIEAYPNQLFPGGLTTDGQVRANLSGNTWGWQYGLLLKSHKKHSLGFYFRSPVTVKTRGRVKVENATLGNFETGANAKIDLPLNMTVGYAFRPTERSVIEADFGYTRWAAHKRLYINTDPVNTREDTILRALGLIDKDYSDSFSFHLGGSHQFNDKFILRGGALFYTAAVPHDHFIPAVPDSNRLGFSIGNSYKLTKNITLEMAYVNILSLRRKINNNISESLGTSVDGKYFSDLQELTLTLTLKFDDLFHRKSMEVKKIEINSV